MTKEDKQVIDLARRIAGLKSWRPVARSKATTSANNQVTLKVGFTLDGPNGS